jgi:hypothetical protein
MRNYFTIARRLLWVTLAIQGLGCIRANLIANSAYLVWAGGLFGIKIKFGLLQVV